ncbi:patatin-like phospholipase family protein [Chryseobacterium wangxinyae]|uniref:patatin-like phospholipase family protein n=1 Tax=unclassified Chryseobacterium TaxID=2593645 RepID=UPI0022718468|nr:MULTISPECIES: patatin-like phospholipase family protein [unclassified Chryseobacterium]MCY0969309.1 patatin-like phospholipase family protein [Chryseobacterium sp. CY353]MCY0976677.1 patatin-like phospholipase family protein [Chryseobacterium sp. CY350]WBZ96678.1 patatin-like phospholipase family protein [Chryseobacterium sp. CY350]
MNFEKTGLVLSGGGTKGIAHAGVLKFLSEKNIDVDILSCCSAGSIVGCLYAIGKKPEEILDFFQSIYFFNWKHFTFNQPGLVSSIIFANYLKPIFQDMKIGDLDKEVRIVATELVSGTEKIFDKDFKVIDAMIASCSIPGITTPYILGEEMYCDGGVLNNFPADIIRNDCDKLIGVFVSPPHDIKISDLKTIKSIVSRSFDLFSYRVEKVKFEYCDWLISSKDLSPFGNFERKKERLEQIYNIGYDAAKNSYSESNFMKELKN